MIIRTYIILLALTIVLFFNATVVSGQEEKHKYFVPKIEYQGYVGMLLIHREAMQDMKVSKPYLGQEIRMGVQTVGKSYWEEIFKYPTYGVGFYTGFFNNDIIGNPMALYGFMEIPFVRKKDHYWSTSWGVGASFHMNEYSETKNSENVAIATDLNVYVDFNTVYKYRISKRFELGGGVKVQHFSNGAIKHPNLGLNMLSGQMSVAYYPGKTVEKFYKPAVEVKKKKYEFTAMYAGGFSAISKEDPTKYYNSVISLSASKIHSFKRNFGVGVDVFYNEFLKMNEDINYDGSTSDLMSYAGYLSTDLVANKFRMVVQLGVYLWRKVDYDIPIYERVALRYYIIPNLFANVSIKAHGAKAQYLEWGLGVTF